MGLALVHRGLDAEGYYRDPRLSMGMRRLSIIDLEGGDQPVTNEDGSLVLCYNGEIYNYVELMQELQACGHDFRTRCDTEVIVHAFEQWGAGFLSHLNGMFAFALWDVRRRELWLALDRTGQKPLYYHRAGRHVIFGSEVKAILECPQVERRANLRAIDSYLALRYVPQPETLFGGIEVLPAGHLLHLLEDGEVRVRRYWDVPRRQKPARSVEELRDAFETLFLDAVRLTMRADVPVGAYLSGGIDSSLVVAAMTRVAGGRINTFSIGFGSDIDETSHARVLADHLGCTHHELTVTPDDFALLPRALWHLERPIGDTLILAYYRLAQEAARYVKVVLSGEGADEAFAGYSFQKIIRWTEWCRRVVPAGVMRRVVAPAVGGLSVGLLDRFFTYPAYLGRRGRWRAADFLAHYGRRHLNENYVALRTLFDPGERQVLYTDELRAATDQSWLRPPRDVEGPFLDRLLKLQYDDWLQDNLLLRQDKNTMAHSLELRCPFLDHRLVELAFQMPERMKLRGLVDKWVERDLARRLLPRENVGRSKNPFYLPLEVFRDSPVLQALIRETLSAERVRKRGYFKVDSVQRLVHRMESGEFLVLKQVLSLVILELWHQIFIDGWRP